MPRKSSKPALATRVPIAIELIRSGMRPTQVMCTLMERCKVSEATAWRDVRQAQDTIADATLADVPAIRRDLYQFYKDIREEARADGDRIAALQAADRLAKLTGANEPDRIEHSGSSGVLVVAPVPKTAEEWAAVHNQPAALAKGAKG